MEEDTVDLEEKIKMLEEENSELKKSAKEQNSGAIELGKVIDKFDLIVLRSDVNTWIHAIDTA